MSFIDRVDGCDRMRDSLVYYAAITGRFGGQGAQLQNLPRQAQFLREQIELGLDWMSQGAAADAIRMFIGVPLDVVSACLRGMIISAPDHDLIGADFKTIEARGLAWLAGAGKLLDVFRRNEDPYCYQAGLIYGRPPESFDRSSRERQVGKQAVLGLGYQMAWAKYQTTCAREGVLITDDEALNVVAAYRQGNPEIPALWRELEIGALEAVRAHDEVVRCANGRIAFGRHGSFLHMRLPSGRLLSYAQPSIKKRTMPWVDEQTGLPAEQWGVSYMGVDSATHRWSEQQMYGGRWTEHAVSGLSRDLLAAAMLRLEAAGYPLILTIHDEAVSEIPEDFGSVEEYVGLMCTSPDWADGLPVAAEGWRGKRLGK